MCGYSSAAGPLPIRGDVPVLCLRQRQADTKAPPNRDVGWRANIGGAVDRVVRGLVPIAALVLVIWPGGQASAQAVDDTVSAIAAGVRAAQSTVRPGSAKLGFASAIALDSARRDQVARKVGIPVTKLDSVYACVSSSPSPSGCHIVGTDAFLSVSRFDRSGESATLLVDIYEETASTRQPIHRAQLEVILTWKPGVGWQASRIRPIFDS